MTRFPGDLAMPSDVGEEPTEVFETMLSGVSQVNGDPSA